MHEKIGGISAILPAYNEAPCIAELIRSLDAQLRGLGVPYEIIVVDDGSSDGTGDLAQAADARVHRHAANRGYGAAVKTGVRLARQEWILLMDADGSYPAEAVPDLVSYLEVADMVVGARTKPGAKIPRFRQPMKWLLGKV
ncbi:MAG TPA: glycosyltransferase family 2 protein, partial [bacterium]|nr:glycosyltransferase family 2 protein [bacterium]